MVTNANSVGRLLLGTLAVGAALMLVVLVAEEARATELSSPYIKSMAISVLPEYDQPRVLVSYQGEIEGATTPLVLSVRVPADANVRRACTLAPPDNTRICQPYTTRPDGEWTVLEYEISYPSFYLEYDYGSVSGSGARSLDFTFWPPLAVDTLQLWVQEPLGATDFALSPEATNLVDGGGFRHHGYDLQNLKPDQPLSLLMTYIPPDSQPSVAVAGPTGSTTDDEGSRRLLFVLGLLALGVFAVVVYASISRARGTLRPVEAGGGTPLHEAEHGGSSSCPNCGCLLGAHVRYCPGCGRPAHRSVEENTE